MARKSKPQAKSLAQGKKRGRNSHEQAGSVPALVKRRKKSKQTEPDVAPISEASLLGIPVELRLLIFEHLMPGIDEPIAHRTRRDDCNCAVCDCEECAYDDCSLVVCDCGFDDMGAESSFQYDEKSYQPPILLVNRQIYNEGIGMLYDHKRVHCFQIGAQEVRGFGERVWSGWYPSPPTSTLHIFDRRLRLVQKLHISVEAGFDDEDEDQRGHEEEPVGTMMFRFRCRIHALVDAIVRVGTIKELAIRFHGDQLPEKHFDAQDLKQYRSEVLRPFDRIRNLRKVCIEFDDCNEGGLGYEESNDGSSDSEAEQGLQSMLRRLEERMCSRLPPNLQTPLINVWTAVQHIHRLGNDLHVQAPQTLVVWMDDALFMFDQPDEHRRYFDGLVQQFFMNGGRWFIAEAPTQLRDHVSKYVYLINRGPVSRSDCDHFDAIFESCESRDLAELRTACQGLVADWYRVRSIIGAEWAKVKAPTRKERGIMKDAWRVHVEAMKKLRDVLREVTEELEPQNAEALARVDEVFAPDDWVAEWRAFAREILGR
ncbi:hypothetical protein EG328_004226 [Venturia inaequalis]|uniref:DUF7730 domain-containing protein n=1 Tax=Venturia inaequalis TaxID=5025 RepID=A0A8H3YVT9_VENIN|nr:hypothetical protein EG328_004226 [Venturia inaequalis]